MSLNNYETVKLESKDGILTITIDRPTVKNAFNPQMIAELTDIFKGPVRDENISLIALKSVGDVFCSGADLNWMKETLEYSYDENIADANRLSTMFDLIDRCEKPVVAAVQGVALGGGVGLVSVCDYVIAAERAKFSLSEVRIGLIPACIGPFVLDKIGSSWCRSLFLSAERFTAERALQIGLIHDVVENDKLYDRLDEVCKNIRSCSSLAVNTAKKFLRELKSLDFDGKQTLAAKTLAEIRVTDETQEGLKAFLEKRAPAWKK